jgi:hypothetical protein
MFPVLLKSKFSKRWEFITFYPEYLRVSTKAKVKNPGPAKAGQQNSSLPHSTTLAVV